MDWSHVFCGSCHDSCYVLLKKFGKKKHVPKTRSLVKSNSPELEMGGSARPGTKSLGMDLNQSLNSFRLFQPGIWVICLQFIYITSSITILNRYDIPIIYLYLYHSIYYDNRYVCIIKRIYETYTAFCCLCIFSFLFSVTYYIELNDPPVIVTGKS